MKMKISLARRSLGFALACVLASGPVWADKPAWAGEKGGGHGAKGDRDRDRGHEGKGRHESGQGHFGDSHRAAVREYYGGEFQSGRRCPPGLARKHNGCMPPGQARKWEMGRPLPREVIYYDVPAPLVVQLGVPPRGYKYVRVAGDILMIAIGTAMVVDAINDLGR